MGGYLEGMEARDGGYLEGMEAREGELPALIGTERHVAFLQLRQHDDVERVLVVATQPVEHLAPHGHYPLIRSAT